MQLYTAFVKAIDSHADNTALQWEGGAWTYGQVREFSNRVGHYLAEKLPEPGKNVALLAPNTPNFIPAVLGVMAAGHSVVPFNPLLKPEELELLLTHSDSPVMLYDPVMEEKIAAVKALMKTEVEYIPISSIYEQSDNTADLEPPQDDTQLSMILYTSGTTGDPKGVMLSHRNIYSNAKGFPHLLQFGPDDTFICVLPLFHTFAMTVIVFGAMMYGGKVMLYPQFVPQKVFEAFVKEKNVIFIAVPPMYHLLARLAPDEVAKNHQLRVAVSGGGPLPVDVSYAFKKKFNFEILEGYGLTEAAPVVSLNRPGENTVGTIGKSIPDVTVEMRNEDGESLPTGEVGELCVMGENVMLGYYKNPDATAAAMHKDGWLRTGDMALIHDNGCIQIKGRYKDLIVSAGENIYPREIEETLQKYPGIIEAAVVAKPDKLRSEVPFAFIVLAEEANGKVTNDMLWKHCKEHLADYKVPDGFRFVDQMPKTATGKIRKEVLKSQLA